MAPHRGSSPKGLCKRTGFLGVTRRENPVRRHFERSEIRGLRSGVAGKCWNIDSIGLFNIARYTAGIPLFPSALPPKGEARRYVANDFLDLIAFPRGEGCDTRKPSSKKGGEAATCTLNPEPNESKVKRGCEEMRIHFFTAPLFT